MRDRFREPILPLSVPGIDELPLAVGIAAVGKAPVVASVDAEVERTDEQFGILERGFETSGAGSSAA
jgi:hypothetical protein